MSNENYHFSLRIDNTEFSVGGDKEFVESNMSKWLALFKDKLPSELLGEKVEENVAPQPQTRGKLAINDFIKLKSPKNYNDLVLTILFYYERYEGLENVGVSFKHISDFVAKMPNHPSDEDLQAVISQIETDGFIQLMPGTEANPKYQVSFTGEQCVKQGFNEA
ncbi:MAG: hypothetical protein U0354_09305 [Candidatus Sericytochromatia bacterium]